MLPTRFPAPRRHPRQLQPPIKLEEESETPSTEFNFGSKGTWSFEDRDRWKDQGGREKAGVGECGISIPWASGGRGDQGPVFSDYSIAGKFPALYVVTGSGNTDPVLLDLPGVALLQHGACRKGRWEMQKPPFPVVKLWFQSGSWRKRGLLPWLHKPGVEFPRSWGNGWNGLGYGSDATDSHSSYWDLVDFLEWIFIHLLHTFREISREYEWLIIFLKICTC